MGKSTRREAMLLPARALAAAALGISGSGLSASSPVAAGELPDIGKNSPVRLVLWFDTEDYILPASDDAVKRCGFPLTGQGDRPPKCSSMVQVEARRAIKRAARVTTAMPTMTQSPSVCGSVSYDSYVNVPAQQPMVWSADRIGFHHYFLSRFHFKHALWVRFVGDVYATRSTILPCDLGLAAPDSLGDIP